MTAIGDVQPAAATDSLRPDEVAYLATLLRTRTGVTAGQEKTYLFQTRLSALARVLGMKSAREVLFKLTAERNEAFTNRVVDSLLTKETSFFRHTASFMVFTRKIVPTIKAGRRFSPPLKIWCAGCSTGQEPYSIVMALREAGLCTTDGSLEILATDLSHTALEQAKAGKYSQVEIGRGLPAPLLLKYFSQEGHTWTISESVRKPVRFIQENLLAESFLPRKFDIVLCRNVGIYFGPQERALLYQRLVAAVSPGGYLLLGGAECQPGLEGPLTQELVDGVLLHRMREAP